MLNIVICTSDIDRCTDHLQRILTFGMPFRVTVLWGNRLSKPQIADLASGYPTVRWIQYSSKSFFSDLLFAIYSDAFDKTLILSDEDECSPELVSTSNFAELVTDDSTLALDVRSDTLEDTFTGVVYLTEALIELLEETKAIQAMEYASLDSLCKLWQKSRLHV